MLICPWCEREIDIAWATCPHCQSELELKQAVNWGKKTVTQYLCPTCGVRVVVAEGELD